MKKRILVPLTVLVLALFAAFAIACGSMPAPTSSPTPTSAPTSIPTIQPPTVTPFPTPTVEESSTFMSEEEKGEGESFTFHITNCPDGYVTTFIFTVNGIGPKGADISGFDGIAHTGDKILAKSKDCGTYELGAIEVREQTVVFKLYEEMKKIQEAQSPIFKDVKNLVPGEITRVEYACDENPSHDVMWNGQVDVRIFDDRIEYSIEVEVDGQVREIEDNGVVEVAMCGKSSVIVGFIEVNGGINPLQANPKFYIYEVARDVTP